jgi:hypothetical protein
VEQESEVQGIPIGSTVLMVKYENLSFQLPPKYAPGTDLISKWILKVVVNLK